MNIDAAVFQNRSIGVGSVLRDSNGQFLYARCRCLDGARQPREAEAIGLKEAMLWVKELGITHCLVETDLKVLVDACNGKPGEAYFGNIVLNCLELIKRIDHVLVKFIYSSANNVAHVLAKAMYSMSGLGEWFATLTDFIYHVLHSDSV